MGWEAPSLLSFLGFFFNFEFTNCITNWCISWDFVIPLTASPPFLGFYDLIEILETASPPYASPRILWFQWLHQVASLGILWSHSLHHHLMHLLGFYGFTHCITTWCISWDFMVSLTTSPSTSPRDASPRILWSHSLHHHLMHFLGCCNLTHYITTCDLTHCITTWCISSLTALPLDASPH